MHPMMCTFHVSLNLAVSTIDVGQIYAFHLLKVNRGVE